MNMYIYIFFSYFYIAVVKRQDKTAYKRKNLICGSQIQRVRVHVQHGMSIAGSTAAGEQQCIGAVAESIRLHQQAQGRELTGDDVGF